MIWNWIGYGILILGWLAILIKNIIEFVTKPEAWAENAKFSHLDENYYL